MWFLPSCFGYTGEAKDLKIDLLSNVPKDFKSIIYKDIKSDSLHYWFKPSVENDSLIFSATNGSFKDTLVVRMRDLYSDSLDIKAINSGILSPLDTLKFNKVVLWLKSISPLKGTAIESLFMILTFSMSK